jgi:hypothetical protein
MPMGALGAASQVDFSDFDGQVRITFYRNGAKASVKLYADSSGKRTLIQGLG